MASLPDSALVVRERASDLFRPTVPNPSAGAHERSELMNPPRVYADFQNLDDANRVRLTCAGTFDDLARQGIRLREGLTLTFYTDDADDEGRADELRAEGLVQYDKDHDLWVATVDWGTVRHASDDAASRTKHAKPA